MKKFNSARLRFLIMLAVLAVVAAGYFTAGGIGNFCGIGFDTITFLCPLGALLAMIAERTAIPMAVVSVLAVLAVCVVLGKVFCAWACPVHFMARERGRGSGARRALRALLLKAMPVRASSRSLSAALRTNPPPRSLSMRRKQGNLRRKRRHPRPTVTKARG